MSGSEKYKQLFDQARRHIMNRDHRHKGGYRDDGGGGRESGGGGGGWRGKRGRGRGRGGRGRGRYFSDAGGSGADGERDESGERERPPPGLSGREIGMWYARRSKARKAEQEKVNRPTVAMNRQREDNIRRLLDDIEQADNVPPQMSRDFDDEMEDSGKGGGWWDGRPAASRPSTSASADVVDSWEELDEDEARPGSDRSREMSADRSSTYSSSAKRSDDKGSAEQSWGGPALSQRLSSSRDNLSNASGSRPSTSQGLSRTSSSGGLPQANAEDDDVDLEEDEVPQVAGLLEYERAHGDVIYVGDEMIEEFSQDLEDLGPEANDALDRHMAEQSEQHLSDKKYQKMLDFRKKLPSYKMRTELVELIQNSQVVVISGETGCGKTTQVPQFILDDFIERGVGSQCRIICTQPRRISAVSVAERVAAERCERCGGDDSSVGYQIRLEV